MGGFHRRLDVRLQSRPQLSMLRSPLGSYQHCRAQGTGERQPRRYPQHRAIASDKCFLDSLAPARVPRFGGGQLGSAGPRFPPAPAGDKARRSRALWKTPHAIGRFAGPVRALKRAALLRFPPGRRWRHLHVCGSDCENDYASRILDVEYRRLFIALSRPVLISKLGIIKRLREADAGVLVSKSAGCRGQCG
jgi:hypothetical protein